MSVVKTMRIHQTQSWDPRISEYHPKGVGWADDVALANEIDYFVKECRDGLPAVKNGRTVGWRHGQIPLPDDVKKARLDYALKSAFGVDSVSFFENVIGEYDTVDEAARKIRSRFGMFATGIATQAEPVKAESPEPNENGGDPFVFIEDEA